MSIFLTIIQFLTSIPKIWALYKEIMSGVARKEELKHSDAVQKLKDAKSEDEVKNATRDLANNP